MQILRARLDVSVRWRLDGVPADASGFSAGTATASPTTLLLRRRAISSAADLRRRAAFFFGMMMAEMLGQALFQSPQLFDNIPDITMPRIGARAFSASRFQRPIAECDDAFWLPDRLLGTIKVRATFSACAPKSYRASSLLTP